ncbi:MAG: thioredoxin-disulfide reductase [Acidobacteriota bacterium]
MRDILIYTKSFCPFCEWAKQLLGSKGATWTEINVNEQPERFAEMITRANGLRTAPQVFIGDRHVGGWDRLSALERRGELDPLLAGPVALEGNGSSASGSEAHDEEGAPQGHPSVIILGSGCAGLTAAIYTARANLQPLVIEGPEFGGQLYTTTDVENFPGFPEGIQGPDLIDRMKAQAERFGAKFVAGQAEQLELGERPFGVTLSNGSHYSCDALIIATGASPKQLGLANELELRGHGVSTCATCDAAFFRDQEVVVVGGGDTAVEDALFLTRFASKVYLIHRRDELRASKIMQERAFACDKIELLWNTEVKSFRGDSKAGLTGLRIVDNRTGAERDLDVEGCFIAIGHDPNTATLQGTSIRLDELGYVAEDGRHFPFTSVEGVFVAGDVHDHRYRQAVTAAGYGCRAALGAERFLEATGSAAEVARERASTG